MPIEGSLHRNSFTLDKHYVYDFLEINWGNCKISLNNLDLQLPNVCQIPLINNKFFLRKLFQNHKTMYRLIACQTSCNKVMVILPLCDLYEYEIEVKSNISEILEEVPTMIETDSTEHTYATVHAVMNGMDGIELNEIVTN